jgi:ABC-type uncharacterized transport system permease subunit
LILGGDSSIDVAHAAFVCALWFVALLAINRFIWFRGLKRFSAQGA